jgi:N-succinyldiaminopimelate aminotransferase
VKLTKPPGSEVLAKRVRSFGATVFSEFSALAVQHGAVNLGQGFPDFDGPDEVKEAAMAAIRTGNNQYAMGGGAMALRTAIAEHSERFYNQRLDPGSMITVTSGATEALLCAVLGLVDPGDEVILFEPFYDSYEANVLMAEGVPRYVLLHPPDGDHSHWWFDFDELAAAFTSRTKMIVINTPHNPTGKVFTRQEIELIGDLCRKHQAIALCDEVYEHIVFPPARHLRMGTLPDFADRTLTVSSAGKTFSLTGWKIGWALGPPPLQHALRQAHQFVTFATAAPLQAGIACALRLPDGYFDRLATSYAAKKRQLVSALAQASLRPLDPEGATFVMADTRSAGFDDDFEFCRFLTTQVGVAAIPPSAFYSELHKHHGKGFARFAYCKTESVLDAAAERLSRWAAGRHRPTV